MQARELPAFKQELQELAECLPGREITTSLLERYFDVLKPFSLDVIHRACMAIVGETPREQFFPKAAELKLRCLGLEQDDAASERAAHRARFELRCQHRDGDASHGDNAERPQCPALLPWPPEKDTEGPLRYYCRKHQSLYRYGPQAATVTERQALARTMTPSAQAFLRDAVPSLIASVSAMGEETDVTAGRNFLSRLSTKRLHVEPQRNPDSRSPSGADQVNLRSPRRSMPPKVTNK